MGAKVHPNSGAGSIKRDGSSDEYLIELKLAGKSHSIQAKDMEALFKQAARDGKQGLYIITFDSVGITLTGFITKE